MVNNNIQFTTDLVYRVKHVYKNRGSIAIISKVVNKIAYLKDWIICLYYKIARKNNKFIFKNTSYNYLYHPDNVTWTNERCVEVPVLWNIIKESGAKRILEVGNVLSCYYYYEHDILDKFQTGYYIINEDVVDYKPKEKYDLIVTISTLEHVGYDEEPKDNEKIKRAVINLKSMLKDGGKIVICVPKGYNKYLDNYIGSNEIGFDEVGYLMRVSKNNDWKEASWEQVKDIKYDEPFPKANALVFGFMSK